MLIDFLMQMSNLTYIFYVPIPCFQRVFYIFFLDELIMCVNSDTSSVTYCIFSVMYHCLTQQLNCSEREVCKIPEKVPVPPPLPTSPLPSRINVPPSPVAVRQPSRTLCPKQTVRVLVTAGVLIALLVIVAVVIAVILGRNTPGTNNKGVVVHVCVHVCMCVCVCICVFVGMCVYMCVCIYVCLCMHMCMCIM